MQSAHSFCFLIGVFALDKQLVSTYHTTILGKNSLNVFNNLSYV